MADLVIAWYSWLSGLTQGPIFVIQGWIEGNSVPLVSALLFGLIGATAPCQLTTNLGALAWSASRAGTVPVLAFNIQWPTLPTLVMAPLLILAYVGLARREDRELAARFGEAFGAYAARTPAFLPSRPEGTTEAADERHPARGGR